MEDDVDIGSLTDGTGFEFKNVSDVVAIAVTVILGLLTVFVANGFHRQLAVRAAEKRIAAYGALWALTYVARPSRHMFEGQVLTDHERGILWKDMSKWY